MTVRNPEGELISCFGQELQVVHSSEVTKYWFYWQPWAGAICIVGYTICIAGSLDSSCLRV
jgi:hypothetical protein